MGISTPVYQLYKPGGGESADIDAINDNMDKVEAALVGHDSDLAAQGTRITNLEAGGGLRGFVIKGADESIAGETLQNDNGLFFSVLTGRTYFVDYAMYAVGTTFDQDIKYAFTHPGGTIDFHAIGPHNTELTGGSHSETEWVARLGQTVSPTASIPIGLSTVITGTLIKCVYRCSASGVLRLQWARQAASGTITVQAGSNLQYERYDS